MNYSGRGEFTHFFEANRAISIKVLKKHVMEVHIENDSERRTKILIRYLTVLVENDKPRYRIGNIWVPLVTRTKYGPPPSFKRALPVLQFSRT